MLVSCELCIFFNSLNNKEMDNKIKCYNYTKLMMKLYVSIYYIYIHTYINVINTYYNWYLLKNIMLSICYIYSNFIHVEISCR